MNIRFAKRQDLPHLVEIYNQAIAAKSTATLELVDPEDRESWFDGHNKDKHPILVAEFETKILGYLYLSPYRAGRSALEQTVEVSYFVDFNHHHKGIGSSLLEACLEKCPDLGIKSLFAILLDTNEASINLLKKHGFEQWAFLPDVAEIDGVEVSQVYFGRKI
ncbi:MAG: N-acetyltransferase [Candidatus Marinimicrobia bacterium]|jgi:phosphinothricin acetyltransferase|nr:N-acetyltransferase [Candidatus Neomarinimicrobiota bacterium]MBT3575889.1 N-acetyltransferase [Candidatus Neomarinimicrobiota bacterium]MBT3679414.1 N-acetyltransferase [Candidatus Neomarinimicrobiota bacterium]MBT3951117.1 N-acetyltransferase [Candidatus Neomarinimicrobiota bacterium]MBT4254203.1 N-acetyltransferase [Candidatus Neomarinimicrobiota bacterium]